MNVLLIPRVNKAKYRGVYFFCNSDKTGLSHDTRKFYIQFNNVTSVFGKGSYETNAVRLVKT